MLAMDVVDTLRHNERLVERELGTDQRDQALIKRLREIYTAQGIEVTDAVLEEGVKALEEKRFHYTPPPTSFQTWLATIYVRRDRWGKPLLIGLALVLIVGLGYRFGTTYWESRQASVVAEAPELLAGEVEAIRRLAKDEKALEKTQAIRARAEAAVATGDVTEIEAAMTELRTLRASLDQEYAVRIISRPGERSGVFRIPADNPSAKNYYLVVEAIGTNGEALSLPITSEEDGSTKTVKQWGTRVNEGDYAAVAADKQDDGIIQNRDIGIKERGRLEPRYTIPIPGGTITAW
jgi:hypothetical protein